MNLHLLDSGSLEYPSESTILGMEKDSSGFFLVKMCFLFINCSHWGNISEITPSFWNRTFFLAGRGETGEGQGQALPPGLQPSQTVQPIKQESWFFS